MKNVIISGLIVAILSAGVCIFSVSTVGRVCGEMDALRAEAQRLCGNGQMREAGAYIGQMQKYWEEQSGVLNSILPHSSVEEITAVLLESRAALRAEEAEEFQGGMMMLGELLRRLREDERLILSNILCVC